MNTTYTTKTSDQYELRESMRRQAFIERMEQKLQSKLQAQHEQQPQTQHTTRRRFLV